MLDKVVLGRDGSIKLYFKIYVPSLSKEMLSECWKIVDFDLPGLLIYWE